MSKKIEFGDFQTNVNLATEVVKLINRLIGIPSKVIEPTSGLGNFIIAAYNIWGDKIIYEGYEISDDYYKISKSKFANTDVVTIIQKDFFINDWKSAIGNNNKSLILGNPPWVTNATLGSLNSKNLPQKNNFQNHRGFDAKTGKANFDIAEWMIIKLVESMSIGNYLGMLCKRSTARKVLLHFWKQGPNISNAKLFLIDAKKEFDVNVDACFLFLCKSDKSNNIAEVYNSLSETQFSYRFGYKNNELISNIDDYERNQALDGFSNIKWRSGIKHDAAKVMEISLIDGHYINGFEETVDIEEKYIYPLLKSSDLGNGRVIPRKFVIVTQKNVGDDTNKIKKDAPKTWSYLIKYANILDNRRSTIYNNRPKFSIFGIGDYSFSDWKVAISGLYKSIQFIALPPYKNKPIMVDDTCYFIPCNSEQEAELWENLLNSKRCNDFLHSLIFFDAKRPITNDILKRINLNELARIENVFLLAEKFLSVPYESDTDSQGLLVFDKKRKYKIG